MTTRTGWLYKAQALMDPVNTGSVVGSTGEYSQSDLPELTSITCDDDTGMIVIPGHFSLVSPEKVTGDALSPLSSIELATGTPSSPTTRVEDECSHEVPEAEVTLDGGNAVMVDNAPQQDALATKNAADDNGNARYAEVLIEEQVQGDRSSNLSDNNAFSSWRDQPSEIEDSSLSSESTNSDDVEGDGIFTVSCHIARPCSYQPQRGTLNVMKRYFNDWFLNMATPEVYACQEMLRDKQEVMAQLAG